MTDEKVAMILKPCQGPCKTEEEEGEDLEPKEEPKEKTHLEDKESGEPKNEEGGGGGEEEEEGGGGEEEIKSTALVNHTTDTGTNHQ